MAALDDPTLAVMRGSERDVLLLVVCTEASRRIDVRRWRAVPPGKTWQVVLTTEEPRSVESRDAGLVGDVAVDLQDGLHAVPAAPRYIEAGHARGKVVISLNV